MANNGNSMNPKGTPKHLRHENSVDLWGRVKHLRNMTQKVFWEIYNAVKNVENMHLDQCLKRNLGGKKFKKIFGKNERHKLKCKTPNEFEVALLYKILPFVSDLAPFNDSKWKAEEGDCLEYHLKCARDVYVKFYREQERLLENGSELESMCSKQKELLIKILNKTEERTSIDLSSTRKQVLGEMPADSSTNIAEEDLSIVFNPLLKGICILALPEEWTPDLEDRFKEFVRSNKMNNFPSKVYDQIRNCSTLRDLPANSILRVLIMYYANRECALSGLMRKVRDVRNSLYHNTCMYDFGNLSCNFFMLVKDIFKVLKHSLPSLSLQNLGSELYPPLTLSSPCNASSSPVHSALFSESSASITSLVSSTSSSPLVPNEMVSPSTQIIAPFSALSLSSAPSSAASTITSSSISSLSSISAPSSIQVTSSNPPSFSTTAITASPSVPLPTYFTNQELNVLKLFQVFVPRGPAPLVFRHVFEELYPEGMEGVRRVKLTKGMNFTVDEEQLIRANTPLSEVDLSFLDKLIKCFCKLEFNRCNVPADTLEHHMWNVKKMRNSLMHKQPTCTDNDLKRAFHKLRKHIECIVEFLIIKLSKENVSNIKQDVNNMLDDILAKTIPSESLDQYNCRMLRWKQIWADEIISKTHKELQEHYDHIELQISPPIFLDGESHEIWKIPDLYTELEIINATDSRISPKHVSSANILELFESQRRCIILQGPTGAGKTTLCRYLLQCWNQRKDMNGLTNVDLMILIQCRDICNDSKTLITYLQQDLMPKSLKDFSGEIVIKSLRESRILFLVDGFDEAGPAGKSLVRDALIKFSSSTMIITTRSEFTPEVKLMLRSTTDFSKYILLNMLGFHGSVRKEYICKIFKAFGTCPDEFVAYLESVDVSLGSLTQLPLVLAFMALLWKDDRSKLTSSSTVTQLYREITTLQLKRDVNRQKSTQDRHPKDIERKIKIWSASLGRSAWQAIKDKRTYIIKKEEDELRAKAYELGLNATDTLSILLQCTYYCQEETWGFIHKSIQEFIAADHLCDDIIRNEKSIGEAFEFPKSKPQTLVKVKEFIQTLKFVAGILSKEGKVSEARAQEILKLLDLQSPWSFNEIQLIARECESSHQFKQNLSQMFNGDILSEHLQGYNPESLSFILTKTCLQVPVTTRINITNSDVRMMKGLLDTMVDKGCCPQVVVTVNDAECITDIIDILRSLSNPSSVVIVFQFNLPDHFSLLLDKWLWSNPLHLKFPKAIYPLLWLHLIAYIAAKPVSISQVIYNGDACLRAIVEEGTRWISARHSPYSMGFDDEIILRR